MAKVTTTDPSTPSRRGWRYWLRGVGIGLLILLGSVGFGAFVAVHWVEDQVLTPDHWVALVAPIPKQAVVSTALGSYISDQLFSAVPVEQTITDALPPKAAFLAGPLASQLHSLTTKAAQNAVASDTFQTVWTGANRLAINRLVSNARGQAPPLQARINQKFNVNISGAAPQIRAALGKASTAIPALQPASQKGLQISADLHARRQRLHQAIKTIDTAAAVLPLFVSACLLGALALSARRRRTTLTITVSVIVVMLLELIALKGARQALLDQVHHASNVPAISYVYDTVVGGLRQMIFTAAIVAIIVFCIALAAGPAKWAVSFRSLIHFERVEQSRAMAWWRKARIWIKQWQYYLWLAVAVLVLAYIALFMTVTGQAVANALLLTLSLFALIHIVATPRQPSNA